jgi:RNA polymerase primary sigma factor
MPAAEIASPDPTGEVTGVDFAVNDEDEFVTAASQGDGGVWWDGADRLAPEAAPPRPADELVVRCLSDLMDDWERKGGQLSYDDVTRMTTKRGLDGRQLAALLEALAQVGVALIGLDRASPQTPKDADRDGGVAEEEATYVERDALGAYLKEIGRYPLLWAEDEVRLGRLIKTGQEADRVLNGDVCDLAAGELTRLQHASEAGRRAHNDLVQSNLRLVVSIARKSRYAHSGIDLIDRIQDGNIGLLRAADKFNYSLGYKFSTYATWWIRQSIERGIADRSRLIRLPVHFHEKLLKVLRMKRRLAARYDREPTLRELAEELSMDPGEAQAVLDWARPTVSIDSVFTDEGDLTLGDLLAADTDIDGRTDPADIVLSAARQRDTEQVLDDLLDARAALILRNRYGIGGRPEQTLQMIGDQVGLTRERVRQLETKALETLRVSPTTRQLYEYLVNETDDVNAEPSDGWPKPEKKRRKVRNS